MENEEKVESVENNTEPEEQKLDIKAEIISWIKVVIFAIILAFVLGNFVLMNAYIPSGSMEDTLKIKDRVIGLRLAYTFSEPERGDVVMFKYPDDETGKTDYIKRVIGLPGETIHVREGRVYINDSKIALDEPYLKEKPNSLGDGDYKVPEGCYFMLGDNRNNSKDSRFWRNKYVEKDEIIAKAIFRFWPKFKMIKTDYWEG